MLSPNCGQLLIFGDVHRHWETLANTMAVAAGRSMVGISPNGAHAVIARNFGYDPLWKEPMQLELWDLLPE